MSFSPTNLLYTNSCCVYFIAEMLSLSLCTSSFQFRCLLKYSTSYHHFHLPHIFVSMRLYSWLIVLWVSSSSFFFLVLLPRSSSFFFFSSSSSSYSNPHSRIFFIVAIFFLTFTFFISSMFVKIVLFYDLFLLQ